LKRDRHDGLFEHVDQLKVNLVARLVC
jgi:hypothetical protein